MRKLSIHFAKKDEKLHSILPPPWRLENFSEEQIQKIKNFREGPANEFIKKDQNDLDIARWIVARKWDVEAATKMFIDSMKWRQKENIDTIFDWMPKLNSFKFLCEYWPNSIIPEKHLHQFRTIDGYQVIYERLTAVSPHILQVVSIDELKYFHIYQQELAALERKKTLTKENEYAATVYIQDLADLTMSHLTRHNFHMMNVFTDCDSLNYPETIRKVFIINSPSAWAFGWKISKNFLDPATIEKVEVLDSDSGSVIGSVIPKACLPRDYGGDLDYKVLGGGSLKDIKAVIPKLLKCDVTTEFTVIVKGIPGTHLSWQFRLRNDIVFGIYYQPTKDAQKEIIIEPKKEDPDNRLVEGILKIEKPGLYLLTWDNSANWTKRKLKYLIFLDGVVFDEKETEATIVK